METLGDGFIKNFSRDFFNKALYARHLATSNEGDNIPSHNGAPTISSQPLAIGKIDI